LNGRFGCENEKRSEILRKMKTFLLVLWNILEYSTAGFCGDVEGIREVPIVE